MKTVYANVVMLALAVSSACGQTQGAFWNLESNPRAYSYTIIRYYSAEKQLIGEERVSKWIDIRKPRNIRKLNRKLQAKLLMDCVARVAVARRKR